MIASKRITAIVAVLVALAVILCLCGMMFADKLAEMLGPNRVAMEYETKLFDMSQIISIDILMDESEWNEMLGSAVSEEYYKCDVKVNGTTFYSVGIRPKGNTSLSAIAADPNNDRYSFKLEFDKYIDGQTCFGLDKLILNNNYADATYMKEAVIYDMYQYLGADASLYNYADISVNGSYWGVYLALEAVEDSFMLRNYGVQSGKLYKPDNMDFGGGGMGNAANKPSWEGVFTPKGTMPEGFDPTQLGGNMPGGSPPEGFDPTRQGGMQGGQSGERPGMPSGGSSGGANLEYTDDELESYATIWNGSVTKSSDKDHERVITALKNISEGNNLEKYLNVDNILKYMAVHSFAVNEDSLSGNMAHNYYLYEYNDQLNILPWDYNLSFGGMGANGVSGASSVINDPINTPFSGTTFFDVLLENQEYLAKYHEYYRQLVEKYVDGGEFDSFYNGLLTQIDGLVKTDPNAMYTYEEYETAADMLYKTVKLRARSVSGQLDGTIPSTTQGQSTDSSALIDASGIDIKAMGTFSMGGGNNATGMPNRTDQDNTSGENTSESGQQQNGQTPNLLQGDAREQQGGFEQGSWSGMSQFPSQNGSTFAPGVNSNLIWMLVSVAILAVALVFATLYRRKAKRR